MKNKEKLEILKDVATFAISAIENGVDLTFTFYGSSLSINIHTDRKITDDTTLWLSSIKFEEAQQQLKEFIELTVDKYYTV